MGTNFEDQARQESKRHGFGAGDESRVPIAPWSPPFDSSPDESYASDDGSVQYCSRAFRIESPWSTDADLARGSESAGV